MADQLLRYETYKKDRVVDHYAVYYKLDNGTKFEITVNAQEMDDSSDITELKTKANKRAKTAKTTLTTKPLVKTTSADLNETVAI